MMREEKLLEMALGKDGDLSTAMSVKDCKEMSVILVNIVLEDMGVFHGFPPAPHVSYGSNKILVF